MSKNPNTIITLNLFMKNGQVHEFYYTERKRAEGVSLSIENNDGKKFVSISDDYGTSAIQAVEDVSTVSVNDLSLKLDAKKDAEIIKMRGAFKENFAKQNDAGMKGLIALHTSGAIESAA